MSKTIKQPNSARCSEAYFAEVDFPGVIQPRLVIEYTDGLKIIIGSQDGLGEHLGQQLVTEAIFGFVNKRRNRLKLLYFDRTGLWVAAKRLHQKLSDTIAHVENELDEGGAVVSEGDHGAVWASHAAGIAWIVLG